MKIAILDKVHPIVEEELTKLGWQCDNLFEQTREELLKIIHLYQGIILRSRIKIDKPFLEKATSLKFIGRPGAGLENIDVDFCKEQNIQVFRSPEGNRDAVAEHALGMLLNLFNNINRADTEVRGSTWLREENRGVELKGKTIGIIGYGYMGKAFAQRLKGFDVTVLAYDKYISGFGNNEVQEVDLQTIFEKSNVVSLHTPLTEETNGMVDKNFLSQFKNPIYFINTARGKSVNTSALVDKIKTRDIVGVCLDVLEYESATFMNLEPNDIPEPMQYLMESERAILTPHIAGWTHEAKYKMGKYLVEKIIKEFT